MGTIAVGNGNRGKNKIIRDRYGLQVYPDIAKNSVRNNVFVVRNEPGEVFLIKNTIIIDMAYIIGIGIRGEGICGRVAVGFAEFKADVPVKSRDFTKCACGICIGVNGNLPIDDAVIENMKGNGANGDIVFCKVYIHKSAILKDIQLCIANIAIVFAVI